MKRNGNGYEWPRVGHTPERPPKQHYGISTKPTGRLVGTNGMRGLQVRGPLSQALRLGLSGSGSRKRPY